MSLTRPVDVMKRFNVLKTCDILAKSFNKISLSFHQVIYSAGGPPPPASSQPPVFVSTAAPPGGLVTQVVSSHQPSPQVMDDKIWYNI